MGAGAGGLATAVTAASLGCRVMLIEKSEYLGGTMALSGGGIWIPENPHMQAKDSRESVIAYLWSLLGDRSMRR